MQRVQTFLSLHKIIMPVLICHFPCMCMFHFSFNYTDIDLNDIVLSAIYISIYVLHFNVVVRCINIYSCISRVSL